MLSITTTVDGSQKIYFPFFWVFSGGEERREEGEEDSGGCPCWVE